MFQLAWGSSSGHFLKRPPKLADEEDVRLAGLADCCQQAVELAGFDGGLENPASAAFAQMPHGQHQVRRAAGARQDVGDDLAVHLHLAPPGLVGIVDVLELVGTDVGNLAAFFVDEAKVHEAVELAAHGVEYLGKVSVAGQLFEAVGLGNEADCGKALAEEHLQRRAGALHHVAQGHFNLARHGGLVLVVVDPGEHQQGRDRNHYHQRGEQASQRAVALRRHVVGNFPEPFESVDKGIEHDPTPWPAPPWPLGAGTELKASGPNARRRARPRRPAAGRRVRGWRWPA